MVFKDPQQPNTILHKLVDLRRPLFHIPSLAIHLDTDRSKFEFNTEQHLRPIMAHIAGNESDCSRSEENGENGKKKEKSNGKCEPITNEHHELFLKVTYRFKSIMILYIFSLKAVANETGCKPEEILDLDLYLYDTHQAVCFANFLTFPPNPFVQILSGFNEEFISGARLDNLVGTYTAIKGLIDSLEDEKSFSEDPNVRLVACFDNEEVDGADFERWFNQLIN